MVIFGPRVLLLLAMLLPALRVAASPVFDLALQQGSVEYGRPLRLTLRSNREQPSLETVDLSRLDRDFVVDTPAEVMEEGSGGGQYWRIRLYARRPGKLMIPSLTFSGARSAPVAVEIRPARNPETHSRIRVSSEVPEGAVWVKQPLRVVLHIETDDPYANVETENPWQAHIETRMLPLRKSQAAASGKGRFIFETGWILTPSLAGPVSLQLPPVKIRKDGVITHRFYPPRLRLQVRALPSFIPPTMPLGKQSVEVSVPGNTFFVKGRTYALTLKIHTEARPGRKPVEILRQFPSTPEVRYLAPQKLSASVYRLPFVPQSMGRLDLPDLRVQFFDPTTGKIHTGQQAAGSLWVISSWIRYALLVGLLVLVLLMLKAGYRWMQRKYRRFVRYRQALQIFQQARHPAMLKSGLMEIARAELWSANLTLKEWNTCWRQRFSHFSWLEEALQLLQALHYGQQAGDLYGLRQQLQEICYWRQPLLRVLDFIKRSGS